MAWFHRKSTVFLHLSVKASQMSCTAHWTFCLATSSEGRVSRIYLSGGTAQVSSLAPTIESRVGVPVELLDPFKAVQVDNKQFNLEFITEYEPAQPSPLDCLEGAERPMIRINLLPIREAERQKSGRQFLLLALILVMGQCAFLFIVQRHGRRVKADKEEQ